MKDQNFQSWKNFKHFLNFMGDGAATLEMRYYFKDQNFQNC